MPKLIDYVARYAQVQEAVFTIVLEEGVDAVTRRSVARHLGVSANTINRLVVPEADLITMAADEVVAQRRFAWRPRPRNESVRDRAVRALLDLVPLWSPRTEQELVWLRLSLAVGLPEALTSEIAELRAHTASVCADLAVLLDVPDDDRPLMAAELQVLVDGAIWGRCLGGLDAEDAQSVIERAVDRWVARGRSDGSSPDAHDVR